MKIVMRGEVGRIDSQREVHHLTARKELETEYKRREFVLSGGEQPAQMLDGSASFKVIERLQDVPNLRRELKTYKDNYERGMPVKLNPQVENELWKKAKRLKDKFIIGMVPKSQMHPVRQYAVQTKDGSKIQVVCDYDKLRETKAIERNQAWLKANEDDVKEFKRIMRMLEPDNPNIADVERFRPF